MLWHSRSGLKKHGKAYQCSGCSSTLISVESMKSLCEWPCLTTRTAASHMASSCAHMCMSGVQLLLVVWLLGFRLCSTLPLFKMPGKRPSGSRFFKFMFMHLVLVLMDKYVCFCCNRTKTDFNMTASPIIIWNSTAKRIPDYGLQDTNTF